MGDYETIIIETVTGLCIVAALLLVIVACHHWTDAQSRPATAMEKERIYHTFVARTSVGGVRK